MVEQVKTQLKNEVAAKTECRLHALGERDQTLSQVLERGSLLARLRTEHLHPTSHLTKVNSLSLTVSKDAMDLVVQLRSHQADHSDSVRFLAEDLREALRGRAIAMAALAKHRASEEDRWKAREKELIDRLTPKVASFFHMGFKGAVK